MVDKISILLSTYNGEKYLADQLESILHQSYSGWVLYIRDDGSIDQTVAVIKGYQKKYPEKIIFFEDDLSLGVKGSFFKLLANVESDFYMFCDQDDIWLPGKVEHAIASITALAGYKGEVPCLLFTDLTVVDSELKVISPSFWRLQSLIPEISEDWQSLLSQNVVTGCTTIFNDRAKYVCLENFPGFECLHDHWLAVCVSKFGRIGWNRDSHILYRQHASNVAGARKFGFYYLLRKLKDLRRLYRFYSESSKVFQSETTPVKLIMRKFLWSLRRFYR